MPNILFIGNFRLVIFPNDHLPPHVHAIGPGWHTKVMLGNGEEIKPRLLETKYGSPGKAALRKVLAAVDQHSATLWVTWRKFHG